MNIQQTTYLFNKHDRNSVNFLPLVPNGITVVDIYADKDEYSGYDWVTSGGTSAWRGAPAVVIVIPAYSIPEYTEQDPITEINTTIPAYNIDSFQYILEVSDSWQEVEDYVNFVNERAQVHPPTTT